MVTYIHTSAVRRARHHSIPQPFRSALIRQMLVQQIQPYKLLLAAAVKIGAHDSAMRTQFFAVEAQLALLHTLHTQGTDAEATVQI
jgi:hypothetical protein